MPAACLGFLGAAGETADLDLAKLLERFLELAREARAVEAEDGEGAVQGVDVGFHGSDSAVEQVGFQGGDAVEAPGGVGEFLGELGFGRGGGLVFVEELAAVLLVGGLIFGGQDSGAAGEAVAEGVAGGTGFAFRGAGAGGLLGVGAINGRAVDCGKS